MAAREDTLFRLIASAYQAALAPEAWVDFLHQYVDATGAENAVQHWFDKRTTSLVCSINTGLRDEGLRDYAEYYCKHDPRVRFAFTHPPGTVFVDYDFTTESEMNRSAYYSDFLRGQDLRYCVAVVTLDDATQHCGIAAHRTARQGHFDAPDVNITQVLMPHLRRAIQLQDRLRAIETRERSLTAALDRLTIGAIFVDAYARPLIMNRAAEKLCVRTTACARRRTASMRQSRTRLCVCGRRCSMPRRPPQVTACRRVLRCGCLARRRSVHSKFWSRLYQTGTIGWMQSRLRLSSLSAIQTGGCIRQRICLPSCTD